MRVCKIKRKAWPVMWAALTDFHICDMIKLNQPFVGNIDFKI